MPVYFLGEDEKGGTWIQIGVAKKIEAKRLKLQTASSEELGLFGWIETGDAFQVERLLQKKFDARHVRGEWFHIELADILPVFMQEGRHGFIAKNADDFQIVGYDRDAIPEYLRVW